jgi:hypothetical protein
MGSRIRDADILDGNCITGQEIHGGEAHSAGEDGLDVMIELAAEEERGAILAAGLDGGVGLRGKHA